MRKFRYIVDFLDINKVEIIGYDKKDEILKDEDGLIFYSSRVNRCSDKKICNTLKEAVSLSKKRYELMQEVLNKRSKNIFTKVYYYLKILGSGLMIKIKNLKIT